MALQGLTSDLQLFENKSLFQSLQQPHEVWVWNFSAFCSVLFGKPNGRDILEDLDVDVRTP
jgi:hypothetical protein